MAVSGDIFQRVCELGHRAGVLRARHPDGPRERSGARVFFEIRDAIAVRLSLWIPFGWCMFVCISSISTCHLDISLDLLRSSKLMVYFDNLGWHRDWLELQRAELQPEGHCGESATPVEKGEGLSEILPPLR